MIFSCTSQQENKYVYLPNCWTIPLTFVEKSFIWETQLSRLPEQNNVWTWFRGLALESMPWRAVVAVRLSMLFPINNLLRWHTRRLFRRTWKPTPLFSESSRVKQRPLSNVRPFFFFHCDQMNTDVPFRVRGADQRRITFRATFALLHFCFRSFDSERWNKAPSQLTADARKPVFKEMSDCCCGHQRSFSVWSETKPSFLLAGWQAVVEASISLSIWGFRRDFWFFEPPSSLPLFLQSSGYFLFCSYIQYNNLSICIIRTFNLI